MGEREAVHVKDARSESWQNLALATRRLHGNNKLGKDE